MRSFLLTLCTAILLLAGAPHAHAANLPSSILPSCDETRYIIQSKSGSAVGTNGPLPPGATIEIAPEQFDKAPYLKADWQVVDYTTTKNCGFDDFLQVFVNLFNWGLYVLSILALFFFFLGGGTLLLSGGSEERVRTGKAILVNTVIGIGITLGSWVIVNLTVNTLLPEDSAYHKNGIGWLTQSQPWFRINSADQFVDCSDPPSYPCKNGAGGSTVRDVQGLLYDKGCYTNPGTRTEEVDGSFGQKTLTAWNVWQQWNSQSPTTVLEGYQNFTVPCNLITEVPSLP
jgi:hypothetical protein